MLPLFDGMIPSLDHTHPMVDISPRDKLAQEGLSLLGEQDELRY